MSFYARFLRKDFPNTPSFYHRFEIQNKGSFDSIRGDFFVVTIETYEKAGVCLRAAFSYFKNHDITYDYLTAVFSWTGKISDTLNVHFMFKNIDDAMHFALQAEDIFGTHLVSQS